MKPVIGIFAHPDDEAFGPSGTLALMAKEREVYLICVTNGEAGQNSVGKHANLADIRRYELEESANVLGIKQVFFLEYKDGTLSNNLYHEIADKIQLILDDIQPELCITFEPQGLSGHIDHIAVCMISSFLFENSKTLQELWQYCLDEDQRSSVHDYFIYFPPGYEKAEIGKRVDIVSVWEQKVLAMRQHKSQKKDMEMALKQYEDRKKIESFIVKKKQ